MQLAKFALVKFALVKTLVVMLGSTLFADPAFGQRADVPTFDKKGNFHSTKVPGNRGSFQQLYWLVIDKDPKGLNCRARTANDKPEVSLSYGSIIQSDLTSRDDNAISIQNGQTWLRVKVTEGFQTDYRKNRSRSPYSCIVRANNSLIAPINHDDLKMSQ